MLPTLPKAVMGMQSPLPQGVQFPQNIAGPLQQKNPDLLRKMQNWLITTYLLPQIMERRPYEPLWDKLLSMYKVKYSSDNMRFPQSDGKSNIKDRQLENTRGSGLAQVSDSLIYDAVDRLKNLNHFISWKTGTPIQYQTPAYINNGKEDEFYFPVAEKFESYNGILSWNIKNQDIYRKHLILCQHHYLYGICFVISEFLFKAEPVQKQNNQGQMVMNSEITDIGVSFEPLSLRRLWLNYRQPAWDMNYQSCPFYFQAMPRFAILQNVYDPILNPFGYQNLDSIPKGMWMFSAPEMDEARKALAARLGDGLVNANNLVELLSPEYSVEALWTFHPMVPFDEITGDFEFRPDGKTPVPVVRYIWQIFANNLMSGNFNTIRLQKNFYPRNAVPLFGSQHMPDLDSGMYSPSIGEILENHYSEICTAMNQFLDNKNLINDPPSWSVIASPCENQDVNLPGARIKVNSPNDMGWRPVYDGTHTTQQMMELLREQGQTTSKTGDAILGKALGGRTSATEASNAFQAAMSGVTTDINIFNYDIMGNYANRVWEYTGLWFSSDLLKAITGMFGPQLSPEDMWARIDLKWDIGSAFIESIVKQGNIRYALEASVNSPVLDQATLWRQLFTEFRMPECIEAIRDGGFETNIYKSTDQATSTYMGEMIIIDPTQDHNIAIQVKIRFLQDKDSKWNVQYGALPSPAPDAQGKPQSRAQYLAMQIQIHQQFAMLQMQQQAAQAHLQNAQANAKANPPKASGQGDQKKDTAPQTAGQHAQQQPSPQI